MADYKSEMVVEGWIESGEFPVVMVTRTFPVMEAKVDVKRLSDYILKWAVVKVTCGDETVILTGKYDQRYYPPYIYTTGEMRGEEGKTYTLTVDYRDMHAKAEATIPKSPTLDSVQIGRVPQCDTLRTLTACFADPVHERNYYQLFVRKGASDGQFLTAYHGCMSDRTLGTYTRVPVYQGHRYDTKDYTPYFAVGDTVAVKLAQLDSISFSFWKEYEEAIDLHGNFMFPKSTNLPTNVQGGSGCWYGMGGALKWLIVK